MAKKEEISKAELYRKERKERLAKEAKKNAKRNAKIAKVKRIALRACAIVVAAAIVLGATVAIVNYTGSSLFRLTVAKVGDTKVSTSEFQYYYRTAHANIVSQASQADQYYGAGYYAQNQGYDYTLLPSEQPFPNEMLGEDMTETFETWDDYITYSTMHSIQVFNALAFEAEKAGIELTEEDTKAITDQIEELRTTAAESGRSLNAYLRASYGSGINENSLEKWMLRDALAQKYAEIKQDELFNSYTTEEVNKEYKDNAEDYSYIDVRYYVFNVDTVEVKEGQTESEVIAAQEKAAKKAEKEAKEFLKDIKSEKDFIAAADKLDKANAKEETEDSMLSADETTLLEKFEYAAFVQSFGEKDADWAFSTSRKSGEKKVFAYEENGIVTNYYAFYITNPIYKDEAVSSDLKGYTFTYAADAGDDEKAETKANAQALVDEWNSLPAEEKTAEEFAHIAHHALPDQADSITCTDYADYADGTLADEVDEWANAKSRKPGDVSLIETASGFYVMYYEAKNTEANWQLSVRTAMRDEAFADYQDELVESEEYALVKDGALKELNLKIHKSKLERDLTTYLYSLMQSMQASQNNTVSY